MIFINLIIYLERRERGYPYLEVDAGIPTLSTLTSSFSASFPSVPGCVPGCASGCPYLESRETSCLFLPATFPFCCLCDRSTRPTQQHLLIWSALLYSFVLMLSLCCEPLKGGFLLPMSLNRQPPR